MIFLVARPGLTIQDLIELKQISQGLGLGLGLGLAWV